jgi:DNA-3-methyladenine glycosylase II
VDRLGARIVRADPAFRAIVESIGPMDLRPPQDDAFQALVRSIVFQQLAGAAANAIHTRVVALFAGPPTPEAMLALAPERLRAAGLSAAKLASLLDLAQHFAAGAVPYHDLDQLSDEEVVARLIPIRGIGRWTAEMFLIFQLRRLDVWPVDDYGVRKGWTLAHKLKDLPAPRALQAEGDLFKPYRTIAAWYCWRAVDTVLPI